MEQDGGVMWDLHDTYVGVFHYKVVTKLIKYPCIFLTYPKGPYSALDC